MWVKTQGGTVFELAQGFGLLPGEVQMVVMEKETWDKLTTLVGQLQYAASEMGVHWTGNDIQQIIEDVDHAAE